MPTRETASAEFYNKLLTIFTDKFTSSLYERQAVGIEKICKRNPNGFVSFISLFISFSIICYLSLSVICISFSIIFLFFLFLYLFFFFFVYFIFYLLPFICYLYLFSLITPNPLRDLKYISEVIRRVSDVFSRSTDLSALQVFAKKMKFPIIYF